jgi:VWFA-related protein
MQVLPSMRIVPVLICALVAVLLALLRAQDLQLHSRSDLVVAPVSVTDHKGAPAEGLSGADLILYDNNVPRAIHVDDVFVPISLVLVVQATVSAQPVLEKLRKEASLLEPLIAGDEGDAALIAFASEFKILNDFTSDVNAIAKSLRNLDVMGGGGSVNDAVSRALQLFGTRAPGRRRVILLIAEKHDRSSKSRVEDVIAAAQKANVTIYPVTFSPSSQGYTTKALHFCDPPGPEKKCKNCDRTCGMCARQCFRDDGKQHDPPPPADQKDMNLLAIFVEMKRLADTDLAAAFARSSGGMTTTFLRKDGLEKALESIGADLHAQYLVSFQPDANAIAGFHAIRVEVKGRPELVVRTRPGYWKTE